MRPYSTEYKEWILALAKKATEKERKEWSMSEQKNQWKGQPLPQGEFQEMEAQALEAVTGGVIEFPTPIGLNKYLYASAPHPHYGPGTVTLHTTDISVPEHTATMGNMPMSTVWQHVPVPQPNGQILHTYDKI